MIHIELQDKSWFASPTPNNSVRKFYWRGGTVFRRKTCGQKGTLSCPFYMQIRRPQIWKQSKLLKLDVYPLKLLLKLVVYPLKLLKLVVYPLKLPKLFIYPLKLLKLVVYLLKINKSRSDLWPRSPSHFGSREYTQTTHKIGLPTRPSVWKLTRKT